MDLDTTSGVVTIGKEALARLFNVDVRTIGNWQKGLKLNGFPRPLPVHGKGQFRLIDVIAWREEFWNWRIEAEAARLKSMETLREAETRRESAEASIAEEKLAVMRKLVITREAVSREIADVLVAIRGSILAYDAKLAPVLVSKMIADVRKKDEKLADTIAPWINVPEIQNEIRRVSGETLVAMAKLEQGEGRKAKGENEEQKKEKKRRPSPPAPLPQAGEGGKKVEGTEQMPGKHSYDA